MQLKTKSGQTVYMPSKEEDTAINAGIATDADAHELDAAWFAQAKPASEVLPPTLKIQSRRTISM